MSVGRVSAGVVPFRRTPAGWRVLVLRCYRNWDFPKGLVERGEMPLQAALREAREEAALTDLRFPWGTESVTTEPYARGKVAVYFVAETDHAEVVLPVNPALGRPEHHEGRWVVPAEAHGLLVPRLQAVLAWALGRTGLSGR